MSDYAWIDNLKPGDEVAEPIRFVGWGEIHGYRILKVVKSSKAKIVFENGREITRVPSGYLKGQPREFIEPVTDHIRTENKRIGLIQIMEKTDFKKLSIDALAALVQIVEGSFTPRPTSDRANPADRTPPVRSTD